MPARLAHLLSGAFLLCLSAWGSVAEEKYITIASTTSTENSGLYGYILPKFTEKTGIGVRVVAVGTGQAIRLARKGDARHTVRSPPGRPRKNSPPMASASSVLMSCSMTSSSSAPRSTPPAFGGMTDVGSALKKVAAIKAPFVSRGDDSGTHKMELSLWKETGIDIDAASGSWYREAGAGMGATLNTAVGMNAYTLSDRATWLNFENRGGLGLVVENRPSPIQLLRRGFGKPKKAPSREGPAGTDIYRLGPFRRRPDGHQRVQNQGSSGVLSQREAPEEITHPLQAKGPVIGRAPNGLIS